MFKKQIKRFLVGKPLKNEAIGDEKLGVLWGLPILSSDAISSVAYAGQEILLVLIPLVGVLAYQQLTVLSWCIIGLLALLTLSYRQTIECYPNGGGAYIVAKENLGVIAGVAAGAALSVDYVLTVAVSIASGVEQLTSAFDVMRPYAVLICIILVLLLMIGNLRGIRESSVIFGVPAYAFIVAILSMIVVGFVKVKTGYVPPEPTIRSVGEPITLILMLKAFSSGCTALTGVEAVSNAVPNFKAPSTKYAKKVLLLLALIIFALFGGTSVLANMYHVVPGERAMLVLIAEEVFGRGFMFYYLTVTTFIILVMAANTAYSGYPMLISVMASEGYAPRQLNKRGDRLSFDNGIVSLSVLAIILLILFNAKVTSLIGLYAIGVFISFTLSQGGMLMKWIRLKEGNWLPKAIVNGTGAFVTSIVVVIIAFTKFHEGAWVVVILIPILVFVMLKVKRHYAAVVMQLKVSSEELDAFEESRSGYSNHVIVPIESINKASLRALRYALTVSENVTAFSVVIDDEAGKKLREKYDQMNTGITLVIKYSPYRKVVEPLLKYIESADYDHMPGDMTTVILPQFIVRKWWHRYLHNNTLAYIERQLMKHKHIVVSIMPLQLKDDEQVLGETSIF